MLVVGGESGDAVEEATYRGLVTPDGLTGKLKERRFLCLAEEWSEAEREWVEPTELVLVKGRISGEGSGFVWT